VETPVFMPVGTAGTVKAVTQEMLEHLDARIILGNTYHLFLRPGSETILHLGGLHKFISWPRAMLTDSGGLPVCRLGRLRRARVEDSRGGRGVPFAPGRIEAVPFAGSFDADSTRAGFRHCDVLRRMHPISGHARAGSGFVGINRAMGAPFARGIRSFEGHATI